MRKSTKLKIFRRKKRSVILSVLKRHSLRQHTIRKNCEFFKTATFGRELEGEDFPEGALLYHLHRVLETRDGRKIVRAENCEICHLNLSEIYKPTPGNFLQCHLTVPITELNSSKHYAADDFITVCPNCHAVLHRNRPWLTKDDAGKILF